MKKYFVIYASYLETEGLDASFLMFDTEEEAKKSLKESYDIIKNDIEDFEWNDFDEDSYSVGGYSEYGNFERYEAYIDKKEIEVKE